MTTTAWSPERAHRPYEPPQQTGAYPILLLSVVATVAMLFAAFTAALLIRRTGSDWVPVVLPSVAWVNLLVLFASSAAIEAARSAAARGQPTHTSAWLGLGVLFGFLFLSGQIAAWWRLAEAGVFLPTSPHASFFYMLSAVHGAHVLGGLGAISWMLRRWSGSFDQAARRSLSQVAIFWHFVGAVWLYLMILLTLA